MSDSGEISEFGYIMELLARGKVSEGRACGGRAPTPGTTWPLAARAPLPGEGLGSRVRVLRPASPPLQKAKGCPFFTLRHLRNVPTGSFQRVWG